MGLRLSRTNDSSLSKETSAKFLSVIIPALNEEEQITRCLASVKDHGLEDEPEVIVVDGGSQDRTIKVAKKYGARVISSPRGRGRQLNAGWKASHGNWLLFLHADSRLPSSYANTIQRATAQSPQSSWGCFQSIKTDISGFSMRLVSLGVCLRTRLFKMPYGDQGFFVKSSMMESLNGFKNVRLLEDVDFVNRAKREGFGGPLIISEVLFTSGRRWETLGVWNTMVMNQCILLAYALGVEEDRLADWYYSVKSAQAKHTK